MAEPALYVCDLDGTLLRSDATLSDFARDGLNQLIDAGVYLTVASARGTTGMRALLAGARLQLPSPPTIRVRICAAKAMWKITAMLAVGFVGGLMLTPIGPAVAATPLCTQATVHDYTKPLERLPKMRQGPVTEHLPFAPARVFFNHSWGGPLFVGSGEVGYSLSYAPRSPGHPLSRPLNWIVEARYVRVDKRGRPDGVRSHIVRRLKRLRSEEATPSGNVDFLFKAGKPALYRLEITFSNLAGKRLARYGEYLRVLKPKLDARLTLNGSTFKPGELVTAQVDNYGTTTLHFGLARSIEYFDGASWTAAPNSAQGPILLPLLGVGPGGSAGCWRFTIPPEEPPGQYRFAVKAESQSGLRLGKGKALNLTAEFQIVAPG